jgi:hypothetical protein
MSHNTLEKLQKVSGAEALNFIFNDDERPIKKRISLLSIYNNKHGSGARSPP